MKECQATIGIDARMLGVEQTGIGKYIARLLDYVPPRAPDLRFIVFLKEPEFSRFSSPHLTVEKRRVGSHWYGYGEQLILPLQMARERLDLAHFPHFNVPVLYPGKFVVTIHDLTPHFYPGPRMQSWWRRAMFRLVFCGSLARASRIIAVSQYTKRDITAQFGTPEEKVEMIYEGVDDQFKIKDPAESPLRRGSSEASETRHVRQKSNSKDLKAESFAFLKKRYGIEKPFILYVGVWREHKNLVGLISAFKLLRDVHGLDYTLVLCGREHPLYREPRIVWERFNLDQFIARPGFIPADDLVHFYRATALTIVPSFYEGFGFTGLESLACGTPVAASRAASLPEILGPAAIYFDPHDPRDIARVLHAALTDELIRRRALEAVPEVLAHYSWSATAERTLALYRNVLGVSGILR